MFSQLNFLAAEGEVAGLMRQHDWTTSPLGDPDIWPQSLRTVVSLVLNSKFPMFVAWGPELGFLYNDAYSDILGNKHPSALGRRFHDVWSEIWDDIHPLVERAMAGDATYRANHPLMMRRKGYDEPTWFTFSYSPVRDETGNVAGMYCACTETTAAVLAEQARHAETQRLYSLFEQAPGFMAVLRAAEHIYELSNHVYMQLVGHREIIGKPIREALPELEGQGYYELLDEVYASGKPFVGHRMPTKLQRVPGSPLEERFVDFVFQPILGSDGRVSGIFIQGNDVTEHKHTEDGLRELVRKVEHERQRLNVLLDTVPVGIVMADASGKLVDMNAANRQIWGASIPLTERIGQYREWKGWWRDDSEKDGQRIEADDWAMARALRGEELPRDIVEIEPFDLPGVRRMILISGAPIRDDTGNITGAVVAQMDISDQVKTEIALRESEAKFRTIANAMPQMVWSTLPDGYHDYYNQQWYDYTGVPEGASDGDEWNHMLHPDDQSRAWEVWRRSLATGEVYEIQYRLRHHSGQYRWVLGRAFPVRDEAGKIIRWMGTCTDIHDQKLAEEELKLANQRKDEFLAMLAHELRNPLAPISTAAQLLKMAGTDEKRVRQSSEIISRQVSHMTELVNDLLDVSRVTRGLVVLEKETVDIKSVVGSAIEQARPLIEARRHVLHLRMAAEHAFVLADRTRLIQVLVNLLTNAAKYTPQGGEIVLGVDVRAGEVKIRVVDNGAGIAPSLLPHIFDLFTQGERTPDRSQGGLGLGLALVKSIMALHGGRVEARSGGPGEGSTFTLTLPILKKEDIEPGDAQPQRGKARTSRPLRLMIVDDNTDAAHSLAALLEGEDHQVTVKDDAASALKEASVNPPQVFILDLGLPDMDGYELARRLCTRPENAKAVFIALTGYGQPQDRLLSKAAGFDHHFVKPMDFEQLTTILSQVE